MLEERPKTIKRSSRRWLVALAVAGLGTGILWSLKPHPLLLLSRAKQIADTKYWRKDPGAYFWLSDHEIMLFRTWPKDPNEAMRLDLRTMQETPMTPLNKALAAGKAERGDVRLLVLPSPDRTRFLCHWSRPLFATIASARPTFTVNIDGTNLVQWPKSLTDDLTKFKWQQDSKGFVILNPGYKEKTLASVKVYSCDAPGSPQKIILGREGGFPDNAALTGDRTLVGIDMEVLYARPGTAGLKAFPIKAGAKPTLKLLPLPKFADNYSTIMSPRGDRIAWVISGTGRKAPSGLLDKFFHFLGKKPVPTAGLWVSKVDGSELHEIGRMEFPWKAKGNTLPSAALRPSLVRWMPDGKHLSFIHDEALYTVPVD
jgi:hypothetical protein